MSTNLSEVLLMTSDTKDLSSTTTGTTELLTNKDLVSLGSISHGMFDDFGPTRDKIILQKFLLSVAHGEQDKSEQLLAIRPGTPAKWLQGACEFTDYSGRTFNCTAFEYAYWAKDIHMCNMLESYMDLETKALMLRKINAIEEGGLSYQYQGVIEQTPHFNLNQLKQALEHYMKGYDDWFRTDDDVAIEAAWMLVGKAQRNLPAHIANEYCRKDRNFYKATFKEITLPRTLKFNNRTTRNDDFWFPLRAPDSGLGFNFAIMRSLAENAIGGGWRIPGRMFFERRAINLLDEVRTADIMHLRERLNSPRVAPDMVL